MSKTEESGEIGLCQGSERQLRALVVEDSEGDYELILRELRRGGYKPYSERVETREAMTRTLQEKTWDIVLSDYRMPSFSGSEALKTLRESGLDIPFIVVSGTVGEDVAVEMVKSGADDYLMKNNLKRLVVAVQRELKETAARREAREQQAQAQEQLKQSYSSLQRTFEGTVNALASTAEVRDPYTAGHQRRVAQLATRLGEEMGLEAKVVQAVQVSSILHDIGKLKVPAEILSKPGKLSPIEFNMIRIHPTVSHDILDTIDFPWPVGQIAWQHHERLDGSGYPRGLSGDQISMEARILAVADVVEAMSSHRPYRPALGIGKALEEITQNKGKLYEANVADACMKLFYEREFKFER